MEKTEAILFDLDGTLVDSNKLIIDSFKHTMSVFFPEQDWSDGSVMKMIGPSLFESFGWFTDSLEQINAMIDTYRNYYVKNEFSTITIYPHVKETLALLVQRGYHLAVVTTKFMVSALPSLKHFDILCYFEQVVSLDEISKPKPDPEPMLYALDKMHCQTGIMIGDHPSDILSGKAAGLATCGVKWSLKFEELKLVKPDYLIDDFRQIPKIISKINKEE